MNAMNYVDILPSRHSRFISILAMTLSESLKHLTQIELIHVSKY